MKVANSLRRVGRHTAPVSDRTGLLRVNCIGERSISTHLVTCGERGRDGSHAVTLYPGLER